MFGLMVSARPVEAHASGQDYDIPQGHYYEQGVRPGTPDGNGFVVVDDDRAVLWGELRRLGGVQVLGFPISERFACEEGVCQAFQQGVVRWDPLANEAHLVDVFDQLHNTGRDEWLVRLWHVPQWNGEALPEDPLAPLDLNEPLRAAYMRLGPASTSVYGVPRAYSTSDRLSVLRTQRAVFEQTLDLPGQVGLLPAGEIFRDAGLVPTSALVPLKAPEESDASPPTRVQIPALNVDASIVPLDLGADGTLPVPATAMQVGWYSYGARLGEGGNTVLAGHVDWNGEVGVFSHLRAAQKGQIVKLYGDAGQTYTYQVDWVRDYPEASLAGLAALRPTSSSSTLTLITCSGRFDLATSSYEDRHIVRATLLNSDELASPEIGTTPATSR